MDFDWVELVGMTKLGYSMKDIRHAYLADFINKYRIYKTLFNFEKLSSYDLDIEKKLSSLRDL